MKWAFWKRKRSTRTPSPAASPPQPDFESGDTDADEAAALALRVRTRRRLIGACALLLTAVVLVPMVLDPAPRAVPDTIPIDIPSDRSPFAPHLAAPAAAAVADPAPAAGAVPAAPGAAADTAAEAAASPAAATTGAPPAAPAGASRPATPPATDAPAHGKKHAGADAGTGGKIFVQAAAMSRESAARELASRIAKSGLSPFVERTGSGDGVRYRVRLGPFSSRGDAERSRARLRALGVDANIVGA